MHKVLVKYRGSKREFGNDIKRGNSIKLILFNDPHLVMILCARLQTGRIMVWRCPSGSPSQFSALSPTCFDILSWNFVCHFLLMNIRSSSSVVNFRQFLLELCPFWNLEYWKYTKVFRTFLLHAMTYWAEISHMTVLCCTTDQVRVSSICVNFCRSNAPFGT